MCYFCPSVHKRIRVIKKGRGNRPVEALATLFPIAIGMKKVLRSTACPKCIFGIESER